MKMAALYKSDQENYLKAAASTNVSRNLLPSFNDTDSDEDQPIPLPRRLRTMNQTGSSLSLPTPRRRPSSESDSKSTVKTVILGRMNNDSQVTRKEPVRKDETEKNKDPSPAATEVVTQNRESPVLEAMEQFDDVTDSGAPPPPPLPEEVIVVSINTNDNRKTDSSSFKHPPRQIVLTRNGVKNPVASPITRKRKGAAADSKSKKVDAVQVHEEPVKEQLEEPCDNYTGGKKVVGTSRTSGRKRKILVAEEEVSTPIRQDGSKESGKGSNKTSRPRRASQSSNTSKKRRREKESSPTREEEQSPPEVNKRVSLRKSQRIVSSSQPQPISGPSYVPSSLSLSQQPSTSANQRRSTRPSVAPWPKRTKTSAKIEKKKVSRMESVPSDEDEPFPRASQEPQSSSQSVATGPSCSQGSLALSQQSTSSSRSRYDRRRSIFDIARLSQPSPAPSESFVKRTSVGRKKKEETGKKKKPVKPQEEEPERYVGKHCFGNYHMLPTEKVSELLNSMRPDHDLDPQQVRAFSRNVNYFLEDFFTFYCNQTSQYYGFLPFSELKQALAEQCLIDEDASDLDLIREMKQHFTKEEFEKAEGVLFPSRYSARRDTDDYLIK